MYDLVIAAWNEMPEGICHEIKYAQLTHSPPGINSIIYFYHLKLSYIQCYLSRNSRWHVGYLVHTFYTRVKTFFISHYYTHNIILSFNGFKSRVLRIIINNLDDYDDVMVKVWILKIKLYPLLLSLYIVSWFS